MMDDRFLVDHPFSPRQILDHAPIMIGYVGPDGRYRFANARYEAVLRQELGQIVGRHVREVLGEAAYEELEEYGRRALAGERVEYRRWVSLREGGRRFWSTTYQPDIAEGRVRGFFVYVLDETERQLSEEARGEAERALHELNLALESRIEQRTRDLVALNQELDAFNYSVSHDLRAPLRGIDGFSQVLLEDYAGSLDDTARHYLTRVRAGAERMTALLDSLLRLSRLSRSDMRVERVDLSGIAADTLEALRVETPDRAVTVTIEPGLFAYGDENLLRVVLSVLMENAWKFTRNAESPRIEVGSEPHGQDRAFFVRDNGAGFDMQYADKLFVPFQRLHSPAEFEGQGVGLATVQRIVHRHNGRVWARGAVGEGAVFYFTLPTGGGTEPPGRERRAAGSGPGSGGGADTGGQ